jgi:hypothetical protein
MRQLNKQLDDLSVAVRSWPVTMDRTSQTHRRASSSFCQTVLSLQTNQLSLHRQLYSFFAITSFNARFSSYKSAYICFNRRFSSSSSRKRRMSVASIPPYFVFHL